MREKQREKYICGETSILCACFRKADKHTVTTSNQQSRNIENFFNGNSPKRKKQPQILCAIYVLAARISSKIFSPFFLLFFFCFRIHLLIDTSIDYNRVPHWRRLAAKQQQPHGNTDKVYLFNFSIELPFRIYMPFDEENSNRMRSAHQRNRSTWFDMFFFALMKCSPCYRRAAICQHTLPILFVAARKNIFFFLLNIWQTEKIENFLIKFAVFFYTTWLFW